MPKPTKATTHKLGQLAESIATDTIIVGRLFEAAQWTSAAKVLDKASKDADTAHRLFDSYGTELTVTALRHGVELRRSVAYLRHRSGYLAAITDLYEDVTGQSGTPPNGWEPAELPSTPTGTGSTTPEPETATAGPTSTMWQWRHSGYVSPMMSEDEARHWAGQHDAQHGNVDDPAEIRRVDTTPWTNAKDTHPR